MFNETLEDVPTDILIQELIDRLANSNCYEIHKFKFEALAETIRQEYQ